MNLRGTIYQPWNWHTPQLDDNGQNLWQQLKESANSLSKIGYTALWLPPASNAGHGLNDVGYGIKDWYDLDGTKYGNKEELRQACSAFKEHGIQVYHDQVHNHLMGGEIEDDIWCLSVKKNNKSEPVNANCVWFQTNIATGFPWLGLDHNHFDAYHPNDHECWILKNKAFEREAHEDPWGGCDLDFDNVELVKKLEDFGLWFKNEIQTDGYRFDAVKHIRPKGTLNFLTAMRRSASRNMFAVGEFLHDDVVLLHDYIAQTLGQISMFDVPLQRNLVQASTMKQSFDLGSIFNATLTKDQPTLSVSYVHSHDDMPPMHQEGSRGHYVGDWFISQAYALILLRSQGYPMVSNVDSIRHADLIRKFMLLRTNCTFGQCFERFDHWNTIGWSFSRSGHYDNSMAVVLGNGDYGRKWLSTHCPNTTYRDFTDSLNHEIRTNGDGWAEFECPEQSTSVWIEESKYHQLMEKLEALE